MSAFPTPFRRLALSLILITGVSLGQDKPAAPAEVPVDPVEPVDPKVIAILYDGKTAFFTKQVAEWKKELTALAKGKYEPEFPEYDSGFDAEQVATHLADLLKDERIDVIFTSGVMGSEQAAKLDLAARTKPIMSGALRFTDARDLPISETGTSTLPNYTFISEPKRISSDLALLKRLARTPKVVVLVDDLILASAEEDRVAITATLEAQTGTSISVATAGTSASQALARIPKGTKGVYVTALPRMSTEERRKLYRGLSGRGIPNVAMLGRPEVDLGAMASLRGNVRQTVARRTALNIHLLLQGTPLNELTVYFPIADRFLINAAAARRAGWAIDPDTLLTAEWTQGFLGRVGKSLALEESLRAAHKQNAQVLAAKEGESIADEDVNIARSFLRPQVLARGEHGLTGIQDPISDRLTGNWTHAGRYGVELRQVLFSDALRTNVAAQDIVSMISRHDTHSRQLDAVGQTAEAFFRSLAARALMDTEQENLRLSLNNLELARLRSDIGAAAPNEINRWLQEQARARAQLLQRHSDYRIAIVQLNRVSGQKREAEWTLRDIELRTDDFYFMENSMRRSLRNTHAFRRFAFYLMYLAVENAPELDGFDEQIAAQGIVLAQKKRAFYLPDIALVLSADRVIAGGGRTSDDAQTEGFVGINISLPLTTGGFRTAEVARQSALIRQTTYRREDALQRIEQAILNALNAIGFSHPNIRLTREALIAAEAYYASAEELYAQGAASLVDLLDAQSALIQQKQESSVAAYGYLADVFALQRAIAWFQFDKNAEERRSFGRNLDLFQRGGSITSAKGRLLPTGFEINSVPLNLKTSPPKAKVVVEPRKRRPPEGSLFRHRR